MKNGNIRRGAGSFIITMFFLVVSLVYADAKKGGPNFIIILADDMGYGDASCYDGWIKTPGLERMAAEGLLFTDFHSSGTVCSPTRAGLLTGQYQQRVGVAEVINADPEHPTHNSGLDPAVKTLADILNAKDYKTALFGKWHLGYDKIYNPVNYGFDLFCGYVSGNIDYISHYDRMGKYDWWMNLDLYEEDGYTTHLITNHAVQFIKDNVRRSFFLYIAHEAVHSPFQGPDDPVQRGPLKQSKKPEFDIPETYSRMMLEMDRGINRILNTLQEAGIAENTFVFFFSDNGAAKEGSNKPFRGYKGSVWEGGHRVPAIAWWPGKIKPGTKSNGLAISLDVMPTLLELAGISKEEGPFSDGMSLRNHMLNGSDPGDRRLFWNGIAMRENNWKLILENNLPHLYDLSSDPGETRNLSEIHPARLSKMLAELENWKQDVGMDKK